MAQLFRKSVQEDDPSQEDQIAMPKSFVADNEDGSAGIPKSFIANEAPKKPSVFSKVKDVLIHPKPFDPQDDILHRGARAVSKFIQEHPSVREIGERALTGTSPEFEKSLKEAGVTGGVAGPGLAKIPEEYTNKIRDYGMRSGNYWGGFAGSVAADIVSGLSTGFDPRVSGPKVAAVAKEEPPIKIGRAH